MPMPTEAQMKILRDNTETMKKLSDGELLMAALAEIIMSMDTIPITKRIPLNAVLNERAGLKT